MVKKWFFDTSADKQESCGDHSKYQCFREGGEKIKN